MKKEFVPYELAVKLKALGFNEPCFGYYHNLGSQQLVLSLRDLREDNNDSIEYYIAPTFSQAFRWFREKYNVFSYIESFTNGDNIEMYEFIIYSNQVNTLDEKDCYTYEEAEYDCLDKLIELTFKSNQ